MFMNFHMAGYGCGFVSWVTIRMDSETNHPLYSIECIKRRGGYY